MLTTQTTVFLMGHVTNELFLHLFSEYGVALLTAPQFLLFKRSSHHFICVSIPALILGWYSDVFLTPTVHPTTFLVQALFYLCLTDNSQ